jgi:hypothetical protein
MCGNSAMTKKQIKLYLTEVKEKLNLLNYNEIEPILDKINNFNYTFTKVKINIELHIILMELYKFNEDVKHDNITESIKTINFIIKELTNG